ncbi:hypothetical protein SAMN05216275_1533 [Streptosporangium canum]|uniref:Uncharacterized protein n=1 Tax=Streptosporangium canum TaxID=324952 RepID=A0A1I4ET06_9ACTN|nr:hypothetical protein [Streptosporangium canum]SFL08834.1 hypothetical protein SAMN05216275_1533 [Streptosporangium canum]
MALSRRAREMAAEIRGHDWKDAPYRMDRAGHQRRHDTSKRSEKELTANETESVRTNVAWVAAQCLGYEDPNFDVVEFMRACGVERLSTSSLQYGVRRLADGSFDEPGSVNW